VTRRGCGRVWPRAGRVGNRRQTSFAAPKPAADCRSVPLPSRCTPKPEADSVAPSAALTADCSDERIKPKSADKPGSVTALARYGRHSSRRAVAGVLEPPTRGLGEQRRRPPIWCCSGWRLPRFTRRGITRGDSSLWPCSSPSSAALTATYSGRGLPGIPLCGARTFLPPVSRAATVWLASDRKDTLSIQRATARSHLREAAPPAARRTDTRWEPSTVGA